MNVKTWQLGLVFYALMGPARCGENPFAVCVENGIATKATVYHSFPETTMRVIHNRTNELSLLGLRISDAEATTKSYLAVADQLRTLHLDLQRSSSPNQVKLDLSTQPQLKVLSLKNVGATDQSKLPKSTRQLSLIDCNIQGSLSRTLRILQLDTLRVSEGGFRSEGIDTALTDRDLKGIQTQASLNNLRLDWCLPKSSKIAFSNLPKLKTLTLSGGSIDRLILPARIEDLSFHWSEISGDALTSIANLKQLKSVNFHNCQFICSDGFLENLRLPKSVQDLRLVSPERRVMYLADSAHPDCNIRLVTTSAFEPKLLANVDELDFRVSLQDEHAFGEITKMNSLSSITVRGNVQSEDVLHAVLEMEGLKSVHFDNVTCNALSATPNIRDAPIASTIRNVSIRFFDSELGNLYTRICAAASLEDLRLEYCVLPINWQNSLAGKHSLKSLSLRGSHVNFSTGVCDLSPFENLVDLDLSLTCKQNVPSLYMRLPKSLRELRFDWNTRLQNSRIVLENMNLKYVSVIGTCRNSKSVKKVVGQVVEYGTRSPFSPDDSREAKRH